MKTTSIALLLAAVLAGHASATLVIEADFRVDENFTVSEGGGAGDEDAVLHGSASVNTGAAAGPNYIDTVADGYLDVPAPGDSGLQTPSGVGEWRDYMKEAAPASGELFGSGTMLFVVRPHFTSSATRKTIFSHGPPGTAQAVWLEIDGEGAGVGPLFWAGSNYATHVELPGLTWDTTKWYVLGASWSAGDVARVYLRELDLTKPAGAFAQAGTALTEVPGGFGFTVPFFVGRRADTTADGTANADIALFRLYNEEYFDQTAFDQAYNSLFIPEPASALLLLPAMLILGRGRSDR